MNERTARRIVRERANGMCEGSCGKQGTDWAHRQARSQGGKWTPENGLWLCRTEHRWQHANPDAARAIGWTVPSWDDPALVPVRIRTTSYGLTRFVYLDSEGLVSWVEEAS